jgi:hypothetical protein
MAFTKNIDFLLNKNIYCCNTCFNKLRNSNRYEIKEFDNPGFCICKEIELGFYSKTSCDICSKKIGCSMHLSYIEIKQVDCNY